MTLRPYLAVLVLAALVTSAAGCSRGDAAAPAPAPVATAAPAAITAGGWVDASDGVKTLGARADGLLKSVPVKEGDTVEANAVIAEIDGRMIDIDARATALDAQRLTLEADATARRLKLARDEVARLKPLVEAQAETAETLRTAQAQVAELESAAQLARLAAQGAGLKREQLDATRGHLVLRAPTRGQILRVFAHAGETVAAGAPIVSFVADGPLWVRAEIDERLFDRVQPGMSAQVSPEFDPSRHYPAKVLRVARAVGPVQALPQVRAAAKDDRVVEAVLELEGHDLLIGQRVLVRIGTAP